MKPDARGAIDGLPHKRRREAGVDRRYALSPHHVHEKGREARLLNIRRHGSQELDAHLLRANERRKYEIKSIPFLMVVTYAK